jgi:hypothetical protein
MPANFRDGTLVSSEAVVGKLVSVNVGLPREISWKGRTVRTANWKEAVRAPARCGV